MVKIYAVKNGRRKGIIQDWNDCNTSVKGYSNAEYKSFTGDTYDEAVEQAYEYLSGKKEDSLDSSYVCIYVDGSYNPLNNTYGSGVVIVESDEKKISLTGRDNEMAKMRNVAGEIVSATIAMNYALVNNIPKICICYDYIGIEKWCTGEWKCKNAYSQKYSDYYQKASQKIEIVFKKVKAHANNKYNEMADLLAKHATGLSDYEPNYDIILKRYISTSTEHVIEKEAVDCFTGIVDTKGNPLMLGEAVQCIVDHQKHIGYLDYDNNRNRYFIRFPNGYWSGHPFRKNIVFTKMACG